MSRNWSPWELQLVSVGVANGVSHTAMSAALGRPPKSSIGAYWRARHRVETAARELGRSRLGELYAHPVYVRIDDEMLARVAALVRPGQSRSTVLRDLIEWGLEATEL